MIKSTREGRVPVSTVRTGCIPFNRDQKARGGYKVGENPVKENGLYFATYEEALTELRTMNNPGWRNYGNGNSGSAHKAIGWVTTADAAMLLDESDDQRRVALFESMNDVCD